MNKYIPFLKIKRGELSAIANLTDDVFSNITPFFEIARDSKNTSERLEKRIIEAAASANKFRDKLQSPIFLDNYEVDDAITIKGKDNYQFLLEAFKSIPLIPVTGLDRTEIHHRICADFAQQSKWVALRISQEFLTSIEAYDDELAGIYKYFSDETNIALIIDYRLVKEELVTLLEIATIHFLKKFLPKFRVNRLIIAGSSISRVAGDMVKTNGESETCRHEMKLIKEILGKAKNTSNISIGDYTVVSPDYSELSIDPKILPNIMCPKISYSSLDKHFHARGKPIKLAGNKQFKELAQKIVATSAFRGQLYSYGDSYIYERSVGLGTSSAAAMITPTVNAHITLMAKEFASNF